MIRTRYGSLMSPAARLAWGIVGGLAGATFAATVGGAPWVMLLGFGALAVAALLGGYDSRDGEGCTPGGEARTHREPPT